MDRVSVGQVPSGSDWYVSAGDRRIGQASGLGMGFGEFASRWLECACVVWKPSQLETVQSILRAHLIPAFGERAIASILRLSLIHI